MTQRTICKNQISDDIYQLKTTIEKATPFEKDAMISLVVDVADNISIIFMDEIVIYDYTVSAECGDKAVEMMETKISKIMRNG